MQCNRMVYALAYEDAGCGFSFKVFLKDTSNKHVKCFLGSQYEKHRHSSINKAFSLVLPVVLFNITQEV